MQDVWAFAPLLWAHKFRSMPSFLLIDFFMVNGDITSHVSAESLVLSCLTIFKE